MNDYILIAIGLGVIGAVLGSSAAATVWRLRLRQLISDKKTGEKLTKKEKDELTMLKKIHLPIEKDRSRCLSCGTQLRWFELIPVVSWLIQRGSCRTCHKKIGSFEFFAEIFLSAYFVCSFVFWPVELSSVVPIIQLVLWLVAGVLFTILMGYDKKWFLLPDGANYGLIAAGFVSAIVGLIGSQNIWGGVVSIFWSLFVMSGIYLILFFYSKGRWIGFGDIKLGVGLGFFLADWKLAFLALFAANLFGCLLILPGLLLKKISRKSHIPFGPFLIAGTLFAMLFGGTIILQYAVFLI